jgi:hypothetical protein
MLMRWEPMLSATVVEVSAMVRGDWEKGDAEA